MTRFSSFLALMAFWALAVPMASAARGKPWRLDASQQRDLAELDEIDTLAARWSFGSKDIPINIHCKECPEREEKVVAYVQKKYNRDKQWNSGHWTDMDVTARHAVGKKETLLQIGAQAYNMTKGRKTRIGAALLWQEDSYKSLG